MARGALQGLGHIPFERDDYWRECVRYLGYECITKKEIYDSLGYRMLPTLEKMHRSRADHRILGGGNRSGKTFGAQYEAMPYLFWLNSRGWIISANYDLAEEMRRQITDTLTDTVHMEKTLRPDNLSAQQFCYSSKTHTLSMGNGATLQLKSAESPDSMHAVPLDYIIIDEAALLPYILYDTRCTPRLIDSGGWILSLGTFEFQSGEWFEEYFDIGQIPNDMGIESWEHPTEDNYHVYLAKGGETAQQLGEYYHVNWKQLPQTNPELEWPLRPGDTVIIWNINFAWLENQRKRIPKEIFAARFEARRASSPYTVFPTWSLKDYVSAERASFDSNLPVYLAVDPGGTYAVAVVQFKPGSSKNELTRGLDLCVIDELYYQTTVTTSEVFRAAQHREWWPNVARWPWPHFDPIQGSIDVTAKEQARTWEQLAFEDDTLRSLHFMSQKVPVQAGIQTHQYYLDTRSFWVHPRCVFMNLEHRRYQYSSPTIAQWSTSDPRPARNPKDAWNHLLKALIYLEVAKFGFYGRSNQPSIVSKRDIRKQRAALRKTRTSAITSRFRR